MDNQKMNKDGEKCDCLHHHMLPFLLAVLGVDFLFGNLGWIPGGIVNIIWPVVLIIGGLTKLFERRCKCC